VAVAVLVLEPGVLEPVTLARAVEALQGSPPTALHALHSPDTQVTCPMVPQVVLHLAVLPGAQGASSVASKMVPGLTSGYSAASAASVPASVKVSPPISPPSSAPPATQATNPAVATANQASDALRPTPRA